jgi:hypothetical protein
VANDEWAAYQHQRARHPIEPIDAKLHQDTAIRRSENRISRRNAPPRFFQRGF